MNIESMVKTDKDSTPNSMFASMDNSVILSFKNVFTKDAFSLPIRWSGNDFQQELYDFFHRYKASLFAISNSDDLAKASYPSVTQICSQLEEVVETYLDGKPSKAYDLFNHLFSDLMEHQFTIYPGFYDPAIVESTSKSGRSKLFRARKVNVNKGFGREDIFHIPFNLRNKVATTRYSIAGYPSLYLSSSLELCLEELDYSINPGRYICSRFELSNESAARIIELGIKPLDFFLDGNKKTKRQELIGSHLTPTFETIQNYYLWFPLIAACSFIRISREDPFAIEYVIPQLLMQAIRDNTTNGEFMGIRYFSCSSNHSSEMGFNYVFPTNFVGKGDLYCPVLSKSFRITKPLFLNEYQTPNNCETALRNSKTDYI